jgi:hypothetical protein
MAVSNRGADDGLFCAEGQRLAIAKASIRPTVPEKRHPSIARHAIRAIIPPLDGFEMAYFALFLSFMPLPLSDRKA